MKAIHNTLTGTTTIREIPTIAGEPHPLPEHYIILDVVKESQPAYNPSTHRIVSEWILDLEAKTYTQIWNEIELTDYEIAIRDWEHPEYEFRIVCPKQLGEQYPAIYVHFMMEELPIEKHPANEDLRRIYINTILAQHSDLLEHLQDLVSIEGIPTFNN